MNTPTGFHASSDGGLYRDGCFKSPIRPRWRWHFNRINSAWQVAACLRAGPFTWPGAYPLFFITDDGGALCFECARKEFRQIAWDHIRKASTGWRVVACEVNWESTDLYCDHCNLEIESAYGESGKETR